jgi:hypothetical protein
MIHTAAMPPVQTRTERSGTRSCVVVVMSSQRRCSLLGVGSVGVPTVWNTDPSQDVVPAEGG